nr:reverse transcriptase [Somniosus microcephalus]
MRSFHISCWNIQGLRSSTFGMKSTDPEFLKAIKDIDIIVLTETWCQKDVPTHCPPMYHEIIVPSVKNTKTRKGRTSGGILVWYKGELDKHISPVKQGKSHVWLKLDKNIGIAKKDVYLCAIYIPPIDSPYFEEELFDTLHMEISHFQAQGKVIICGDLNARTGCEPDFIDPQGNNHVFGQTPLDVTPAIANRNNLDREINKSGREVVQLCRALGLYIVNGRFRGDSLGRLTYSSTLGSSVVDYTITDLDPCDINAFTVRQQSPLSDHNQINVYLKLSAQTTDTKKEPSKLHKINQTYRWAPDSGDKFITALNSPDLTSKISKFKENLYEITRDGVNMAIEDINMIFHEAAVKADLVKQKRKRHKRQNKNKKWFDHECKNARKDLRKISNQKHRQPNNPDLRTRYNETLKRYKHTIRNKTQNYTHKILEEIENSTNPKQFWEMWNNLSTTQLQALPIQDGDIWRTHFENLYKDIPINETNPSQHQVTEKLHTLEATIKDNQNPLDSPITWKELATKTKSLHLKKACGPDNIKNEMLKFSNMEMQGAVLKLFNIILRSGCFPDIWCQGLISPIYKSGNKSDPNNYRGICVNSCLGKLFCSILNSRLLDFLNKHNILRKNQIGFLPKHRTADHIYTLHTLIEKHIHQTKNGKIFACFIDFKKAFDSIWHEGLYYKLLQCGIGGKVYDLIKSMYLKNKCGVKIGDKRTDFFTQRRGVRQGCNLSPTLFNIYINELADMLEQSESPGLRLLDGEVKSLFYADDLVLLSPTEQGLQQQLDLLDKYCQNWALTVNLKKTNIMIFQKRPRCQENKYQFTLSDTTIGHTMSYTYLGLTITASGSFSIAVNALKEKARRALYAIKRKFYNIQIPIKIWLKIFDSIILPIALYGSEVWGPLNHQSYTKWEKHTIEALHAEFCRSILRTQRKTPTNACRAELGRYPLIINIQKRALNFLNHLKSSSPDTLHFKAFQTQELNPEKSPLSQLLLKLSTQPDPDQPQTNTAVQTPIRVNQIIKKCKETYLEHWNKITESQSRLECYRALKREYKLADYLSTIRDTKQRQTLTRYRLSDHQLEIEKGRYKKSWQPRENRICDQCLAGEVETEMHFLLKCEKFNTSRNILFNKLSQTTPDFKELDDLSKLRLVLGEGDRPYLGAKYVTTCHNLRTV